MFTKCSYQFKGTDLEHITSWPTASVPGKRRCEGVIGMSLGVQEDVPRPAPAAG